MSAAAIEQSIRSRLAALNPARLELADESGHHVGHAGHRPGGGSHWALTIVSDAFRGQSLVARHRMIHEALGDLMQRDIHALKIAAHAPEQS